MRYKAISQFLLFLSLGIFISCNSPRTDNVKVDKEWYNAQKWGNQSDGSDSWIVNYSKNYHIIDGRAIAFNFILRYNPQINAPMLTCHLSDISEDREKYGYEEPTFSKDMTSIHCLGDGKDYFQIPIQFNKGDYLCASLAKTNEIMKVLSDYDVIDFEIKLDNGKVLSYSMNSKKGLIIDN